MRGNWNNHNHNEHDDQRLRLASLSQPNLWETDNIKNIPGCHRKLEYASCPLNCSLITFCACLYTDLFKKLDQAFYDWHNVNKSKYVSWLEIHLEQNCVCDDEQIRNMLLMSICVIRFENKIAETDKIWELINGVKPTHYDGAWKHFTDKERQNNLPETMGAFLACIADQNFTDFESAAINQIFQSMQGIYKVSGCCVNRGCNQKIEMVATEKLLEPLSLSANSNLTLATSEFAVSESLALHLLKHLQKYIDSMNDEKNEGEHNCFISRDSLSYTVQQAPVCHNVVLEKYKDESQYAINMLADYDEVETGNKIFNPFAKVFAL